MHEATLTRAARMPTFFFVHSREKQMSIEGYDDAQLSNFVSSLSTREKHTLGNLLRQHTNPSLLILGEDVIFMIAALLDPNDRMALLYAVMSPSHARPRLNRVLFPTLTPAFLAEIATHNLVSGIYRLVDAVLYRIPPQVNRYCAVMCDWSPFQTRRPTTTACIHWAHTRPHARVELDMKAIRRLVLKRLGRLLPVVRLSVHVTIPMLCSHSVPVVIHGHLCSVESMPIFVEEINLLSETQNGLQTLYNKTVRAMIGISSYKFM